MIPCQIGPSEKPTVRRSIWQAEATSGSRRSIFPRSVQINIGDSLIFDDLVAASVVDRLKFEIPGEFGTAYGKLLRNDRQYREELTV
jgi:hypothetical protein